MENEIILVGGGGHCKSCIDVIEQEGSYRIAGIVDVKEKLHQSVLGYDIIATDQDLPRLSKEYKFFLITIGQIKTPKRRIEVFNVLKRVPVSLPNIVSPYAYVSNHATVGEGTIIMHQAIINAEAVIGANCIINTKSLIEHEAIIEDHCHISTAAIVNGGSVVKTGSFIGSNSTVREKSIVNERSIIGLHSKIT